jgi:ABC-type branched-subunit amino acid transport system substrate-binding protein
MRTRTMVAAGLVAALVLAGCGSRTTDAAPQGQSGGVDAPAGEPPGTVASGTRSSSFGTLANPCGPNEAGSENSASDLGVTADEIVVTTIADPGGPKPGLDQGMFDSMVAFADWCNSFGGINGRTLTVMQRDAKVFEYQQRVVEACEDSFALVGGLGVTDQLGAQQAIDCGLVNVPGATGSAEQSNADLTYQPLPSPTQTYPIGSGTWIADRFPEVKAKAAAIYSQVPSAKMQASRTIEAYESIGYTFLSNEAANVGETNWGPLVVHLKDAGAQYFTFTSTFEELVPMQKEMGAQGYQPVVTELLPNFYNAKYPQLAKEQGAQVDGVYVKLSTWPFEEADERPAMRQYLDALEAGVPGAEPEQLGVQAFSAGLLFATAAKAAGNDLTRDRLVEQLQQIHEWDGGGLHGTSNPGDNLGTPCFVMMGLSYDGFARAYPLPDQDAEVYEAGDGMACPADSMLPLTTNYGEGAKKR